MKTAQRGHDLPYRQPGGDPVALGEGDFTGYEDLIRGGSPILISAEVPLSEGDSASVPNDERFSGLFRKAIVIDEIRFLAQSPDFGVDGGGGTGFGTFNFAASLRCKFRIGRLELSRDPIPLCMYMSDVGQNPITYWISGEGQPDISYAHMRWILPRPLLLRPNTVLMPSFARTRDGFGGTAMAGIAMVGRVIERTIPPEVRVPVPYVGFFETEHQSGSGGLAVTDELAFSNPFDKLLNIQRFILRKETRGLVAGEAITIGTLDGYVSMLDPDNRVIIPESQGAAPLNTPLAAFGDNKMLPIYKTLAPGGESEAMRESGERTRRKHYKVKFTNFLNTEETTSGLMSMIGWREEVL
jgi:hypothetical protein